MASLLCSFRLPSRYTNLTYEEIGAQFGGKKHSTVIYSIEACESKMEDNHQLKNTVYDIMKSIKDEKMD